MAELFAPLLDDQEIFRLAEPDGTFLPKGTVLPLPDWLIPTSADKEEATQRGRIPGLSVWDRKGCAVKDARALSNRSNNRPFFARVGDLRAVGTQVLPAPYNVDVVTDPLLDHKPKPGWDAHALIEGLARPDGESRQTWRKLRERAVGCFRSQ
jgi:hypothetical protein